MTIQRFSPQATTARGRIAAAALMLALGLVSSSPRADENGQPTPVQASAPTTQVSAAQRVDAVNDSSSSRINGRVDWDVDYPSQLAPTPVRPAHPVNAMAPLPLASSGQL